ncbi:hypothetical protein AB0O11_28870, partial [Kitasatospora sp. NPDC093102]
AGPAPQPPAEGAAEGAAKESTADSAGAPTADGLTIAGRARRGDRPPPAGDPSAGPPAGTTAGHPADDHGPGHVRAAGT